MIVALCLFLFAQAHGLQVNTTEGVVEGSKAPDGDYYAFYGVPYAGPTAGNNRFKGPLPPTRYPGVFNANNRNVICAQPSPRGLIGVENCLTLNIFTKNITTPKPVIVFLNSKEYATTNTQSFSFKRLVDENIVFISMNFRLSIYGFLCLGVEEAPGNAGLKDVIQGLKWINANVANFGGNKNNIVLLGHGSGAAMVDILTMSPRTENLIHKAIALSGSALAPWAVAYDPIGYARHLGAQLEYTHKSSSELARHLSTADNQVLISAITEFHYTNNTPLFAPCIENPKLNPHETVLADAPINLLRAGKYLHIPYIAGFTTREGTLRAEEAVSGQWLDGMQANFSNFLQVDINPGDNKTAVAQSIREFYFSKSPISMGTIDDFLDYEGDTLVVVSVIRGAKERALTSTSEVRLLEFGYMGTANSDWIYNQIPLTGVKHGGILNYLFNYDLKPADESVMESIVKRFSGFAYNGNPIAVVGARSNSSWPAVTKETVNYFYYGGESSTVPIKVEKARFDPHVQRMGFWNNIYLKYYVAPKPLNSAALTLSSVFIVMLSQILVRMF